MKIETKTSTYELEKLEDGFRLTKTAIRDGAFSAVAVGKIFYSHQAWTQADRCLYLDNMRTSPIINLSELRCFLGEEQ